MAAWTYILRCADGSYYVGCTTDIDQRLGEHRTGTTGGYTAARRPVQMIWASEFQSLHDAIACERKLKGWGRAKKEALIRGDWGRGAAAGQACSIGAAACFETRRWRAAPQHDEPLCKPPPSSS